MAYTSDLRIKNLLKEVHLEVIECLKPFGINNRVHLRIFDESTEDKKMFRDGGLSFEDPFINLPLGSNDAGWTIDNKVPLVIVEGTFGTERGQFGDGQLNRFSHSAGVALNNYIGVTVVPFKGESYSKDGTVLKDIQSSDKIRLKYANLHVGMLAGALKISQKNVGKFLIIDPYDIDTLKTLVVEAAKEYCGLENKTKEVITSVLSNMTNALGKKNYGESSDQIISKLFDNDMKFLSTHSRLYTHNYAALTTSTKRDGHGLLGKNLIEIYSTENTVYYAIFIRLSGNEVRSLSAKKSKEFQYIFNHPKVTVKSFDDLIFEDSKLQEECLQFRGDNLFQNRNKEIIKKIQIMFNNGKIRVK